jgi:ribosomal-protein-alanine N-acetyltransferase
MSLDDIHQVMEVEKESFPTMWPQTAFKHELQQNRMARYLVVVEDNDPPGPEPEPSPQLQVLETSSEPGGLGRLLGELRHRLGGTEGRNHPPPEERPEFIIGFVGVWLLPDDAHIVTVAVRESYRRRGIGELLVITAIELAQENQHPRVSLECRVSNSPALALYEKYGFQQVGLRPRYYSDNHEDAYVLSVRSVTSPDYRDYFQRMKAEHQRRLGDQAPDR